MTEKTHLEYLRESALPTRWCPACGHGIVLKAAQQAMANLALPKDKILGVSGIGCCSRCSSYCDINALQTTHGRGLAFATGAKLQRPDINVIVFQGDGDCIAIGGNHFIHAAQKNIDMTLIVLNNNNFAMTGSQVSPTTPHLGRTTTTPFGNIEVPLDICEIAKASGATYVARSTAFHYKQMVSVIERGIAHKGFSVIECLSPCPTGYGRRNNFPDAFGMYDWLRDNTALIEKTAGLSPEERSKKISIGILSEKQAPEYIDEYENMIERSKEKHNVIKNYIVIENGGATQKITDRIEVRLSGSGGQGLVLAGVILAEAGIRQGRTCVQSQSYGPEARGGASRSEVVFSDGSIAFPEVLKPDVLLAMTQQACDKYLPGVKDDAVVLIDSTFVKEIPATNARVYQFPITEYAKNELGISLVANMMAISMLSEMTGLVEMDALEKTVETRVSEKVKNANLMAVKKGREYATKLFSGSDR
jgi:2-oxoglutarate ferredoxin oxidoreductase subunit beta